MSARLDVGFAAMATFVPPFPLVFTVATACVFLPDVAAAGGVQTHDGFFANARFGVTYGRLTSAPLLIQGEGTAFNAAFGYSLDERLAVYAELGETALWAPSFHPNGKYADADFDVSARLSSLGAGTRWTFPQENIYLSLSFSAIWAAIQEQRHDHGDGAHTPFRTDLGFGGTLTLGREWWVADEWGIGVAANAHFSRIQDQDAVTWHNGTFGLQFTATWN
jgi:hypothetical protein